MEDLSHRRDLHQRHLRVVDAPEVLSFLSLERSDLVRRELPHPPQLIEQRSVNPSANDHRISTGVGFSMSGLSICLTIQRVISSELTVRHQESRVTAPETLSMC